FAPRRSPGSTPDWGGRRPSPAPRGRGKAGPAPPAGAAALPCGEQTILPPTGSALKMSCRDLPSHFQTMIARKPPPRKRDAGYGKRKRPGDVSPRAAFLERVIGIEPTSTAWKAV